MWIREGKLGWRCVLGHSEKVGGIYPGREEAAKNSAWVEMMNKSLGPGTTNGSYQLLERMNIRDIL